MLHKKRPEIYSKFVFNFPNLTPSTLVMNSTIYALPTILHRKVMGTISDVTVTLREHDSTVGHFNAQYAFFSYF